MTLFNNGKAELVVEQQKINELKTKRLCHFCVGERYFKKEISKLGTKMQCSYCNRDTKSYGIADLAERIEEVFDRHYYKTPDQPTSEQQSMIGAMEGDYNWERDGEPVLYAIMNAADMPEAAANDIQKILEDKFYDQDAARMGEETEFSSDSYYEEKKPDDWHWLESWRVFERSLKTEARFFSRAAASYLESVFEKIDVMKTQEGRSLVVDAGPGTSLTSLFRARVFQSDDKLRKALIRPDNELGSPPSIYAKTGRMNAHGISVFYGANKVKVAIAEVRPPVGSRVMTACFNIVRRIRLLDLTALSKVSTSGSIFDSTLADSLERTMFLRRLSRLITRPVMPDDEPLEYLTTQAVADFLATESAIPLDGIIFPSTQIAGVSLNIVLFHKAARVSEMKLPEGTEISANLGQMYEEGWETEYTVIEKVPPKKTGQVKQKDLERADLFIFPVHKEESDDSRPSTLEMDLESVAVHLVRAVAFNTTKHKVNRHRFRKAVKRF